MPAPMARITVAAPRTMLPVVSMSISAACPSALAVSARSPVLLTKMPPVVVAAVMVPTREHVAFDLLYGACGPRTRRVMRVLGALLMAFGALVSATDRRYRQVALGLLLCVAVYGILR